MTPKIVRVGWSCELQGKKRRRKKEIVVEPSFSTPFIARDAPVLETPLLSRADDSSVQNAPPSLAA